MMAMNYQYPGYGQQQNTKSDYHNIAREDQEYRTNQEYESAKHSANYFSTGVYHTTDDLNFSRSTVGRIPPQSHECYGKHIEYNNNFFIQLRNTLSRAIDPDELLNFKQCCLKNTSILHENAFLQVGINSTLLADYQNKRKLLRLVLYYGSRTREVVEEFSPEILSGKDLVSVLSPEKLIINIEPNKQVKQQMVSWIQKMPYECPQLTAQAYLHNQNVNLKLYLPCVITKFMEFKYIDALTFENKWQQCGDNVWRTGLVNCDLNLVKLPHDFRNYFPYLIELKTSNGYGEKIHTDLGGAFELDIFDVQYLIKISVFPSQKAVFQIAARSRDYEAVKLTLDTLVFLFEA